MAEVNFATTEDEDGLWQLLLGLHRENGIFEVDEERVREFIQTATRRQGGVIGLIRGPEGLEGTIGMCLDQWWYTLDWCLSERWCYVHHDHRRTSHAQKLIAWAKGCAESLGVPLQMGIMSTKDTEAKERLYGRKMSRVGGLYMWAPGGQPVTTGRGYANGQ